MRGSGWGVEWRVKERGEWREGARETRLGERDGEWESGRVGERGHEREIESENGRDPERGSGSDRARARASMRE